MRPLSFLFFLFSIVALLPAAHAEMGGVDGGGSDSRPFADGAAWFLGTEPVRYCYDLSPAFGVSEKVVQESIQSAFRTWKHYVGAKGVKASADEAAHGLHLSLDSRWIGRCDGSEELKFYFGASNPEIEAARSAYAHPVAFAHRQSYDLNAGRGKGFIWITQPGGSGFAADFPAWSFTPNLTGILIHELGHVLGCEHVDGTIMRADLVPMLQMHALFLLRAEAMLTAIDDNLELYLCSDCDFEYSGTVSPEGFRQLMGRDLSGKARALYQQETNDGAITKSLSISDDRGTKLFQPTVTRSGTAFESSEKLFKMAKANGASTGTTAVGTYRQFRAEARLGTLVAAGQSTLTILVERNTYFNLNNSAFTISILDGARKTPLMEAELKGIVY